LVFEKGEQPQKDTTDKGGLISIPISVVLFVVILSCFRANGINIHSNIGSPIFVVIYFLSFYSLNSRSKGKKRK
jgi:hypothetical protein